MSTTRQRLERLFPERTRQPKRDDSLGELERELLGNHADPGHELSLKERLERLVAVAATRPRVERPASTRLVEREIVALERAIEGNVITNDAGSFYCVDRHLPLDHHHGRMELRRLEDVSPSAFSVLARDSDELAIDLEKALFVDTETTGLAGGSGTYAFLIGLGFIQDGAFVVRQLFMRSYEDEAAMLAFFARMLADYDVLVSYNGKSFDVPLLESRFVLSRQSVDFTEILHFDLLHPARSLWKARFESCRLAELESLLLGLERENDVSGYLIPDIYFRFVRTGDASRLPYVFRHNHDDILSLAALTVAACDMLDEDSVPDHPLDDFSLGRLFARAGDAERSERHYVRAVESGLGGHARRRSLRGLAELHKRRGEWDEARRLWQELAEEGGADGLVALKELAMDAEHRARDLESALWHCRRALESLESGLELPPGVRQRWRDELGHRRRRLERRLL
ncbi:MAG TPA: ribonuclease H-like domain-containing protein [Vicinamibacteria bacterium]|nr:ribonuclease H-like domain-containing protein [Vicinamibacteria bacterium]